MRRGLRALCLGHYGEVETRVSTRASWYCSDAETWLSNSASWYCSDAETSFQALRLGTVLVAMISLAPGVWILLSMTCPQ